MEFSAHSMADALEVCRTQRRGSPISGLDQPRLQFRRRLERSLPMLTERAQHIIDQSACVRTNARANLFFDKGFDIFGQCNGHRGRARRDRICSQSASERGFLALQRDKIRQHAFPKGPPGSGLHIGPLDPPCLGRGPTRCLFFQREHRQHKFPPFAGRKCFDLLEKLGRPHHDRVNRGLRDGKRPAPQDSF
jgi:hypothetical protein